MSNGSAVVGVENRCPTWIWNTSPALTASSAARTAGRYSPAGVRDGGRLRPGPASVAAVDGVAVASCAVISSSRRRQSS